MCLSSLATVFLCCWSCSSGLIVQPRVEATCPACGWSLCCLILSQTSVLAFLGPVISARTTTLPLGGVSSTAGGGFSAPSSQGVWPTPLPSLIGRTLRGIIFQGVPNPPGRGVVYRSNGPSRPDRNSPVAVVEPFILIVEASSRLLQASRAYPGTRTLAQSDAQLRHSLQNDRTKWKLVRCNSARASSPLISLLLFLSLSFSFSFALPIFFSLLPSPFLLNAEWKGPERGHVRGNTTLQ